MFWGCYNDVSRMIPGCFKGISKLVFYGCFKEMLRNFFFKHVSTNFQDVLREFQVCFKKVSWVFQECFKGVSRVSYLNFKGVSKAFRENFIFLTVCFQRGYKVF